MSVEPPNTQTILITVADMLWQTGRGWRSSVFFIPPVQGWSVGHLSGPALTFYFNATLVASVSTAQMHSCQPFLWFGFFTDNNVETARQPGYSRTINELLWQAAC